MDYLKLIINTPLRGDIFFKPPLLGVVVDYALFYAVLALLQEKQLGTSKHFGVISLFDREFIKTGIFPKDMSKILHRAFELRQKGDYMEQVEITKEDIDEILPNAEKFVRRIEEHLHPLLNE